MLKYAQKSLTVLWRICPHPPLEGRISADITYGEKYEKGNEQKGKKSGRQEQ
jgi:hypothetical protein